MQRMSSASLEHRLDSLKESVRNLIDAGEQRAERLRSRAVDAKDSVIDRSGVAIRQTGTLIREHPLASLGIAFGLGYLAVRLLRK